MKSILIIFLFASVLQLSAQDYLQEAKEAREKTNQMLQEDIDRLTHPVGRINLNPDDIVLTPGYIIIDQEGDSVGAAEMFWDEEPEVLLDPIETFKSLLVDYLDSRDSVEIHYFPGEIGFCSLAYPRCNLPEHRKTVIKSPTFEDFINYILNTKE